MNQVAPLSFYISLIPHRGWWIWTRPGVLPSPSYRQTLQFSQSIHHIDFFFIYVKLLMTCHDKLCVHWWMRGATVIMKFLFLFISVCMYLHKCWFEAKCLWWVKTKKMQTDNLQTKKKKLTVESGRAVTSLPALLLPLAHVSHRLHI